MSAAGARGFDDSVITHIEYPDWFNENPFNDLPEILNESSANNKKGLFILFTTEGCSYCDRFIRESLGDSAIAIIMQDNFESIGLEIFDDAEITTTSGMAKSVKEFASDVKVQFSPTLLFYDNNGNRILRITGYKSPDKFSKILSYVVGDHHRSLSFRDYLLVEKQRAATSRPGINNAGLTANRVFAKPPYLLDRSKKPSSKPLLVVFEGSNCIECKNFHANVFSSKDVIDKLHQFEVVRLNARDDKTAIISPDGKTITPASWYHDSAFTQIPAMLFFDEDGNEVLKTDALVLKQRMINSLDYVQTRSYEKGWSYQRYARTIGLEKLNKKRNNQ
jgi:thioredoxin-related protein